MPNFSARQAIGVGFAAIICVVFNISFAAIIYSGELALYLQHGIGLALLGSVVLGAVGALTLSCKGAIVQAQDAPAILLSGSVAALVAQGQLAGEALFATVAALVFVSSLACGLAAFALGKWRLALLARYIPFPVLAGFLVATGVLLFKGGVELAIGNGLSAMSLSELLSPRSMLKWVPVLGAAILVMIAIRVFHNRLTLPVSLIAVALGFMGLVYALGLGADAARAHGFLLGPFPAGSMLQGVGPSIATNAHWGAVVSQMPVVLTVVAIFLIGMTLNASGLELELDTEIDLNREAAGTGLANTLGAFMGAIPGYHHMGQTLLGHKLGLAGPVAGLSGALAAVVVLLLGATPLSFLPVGLFATMITFLGLDLIHTWFWGNRHKLHLLDYAIVTVIPLTALVFSFLTAICVGFAVALCIFVISYSRQPTIRLQGTVATRRSFVERPQEETEHLSIVGKQARFIELTGYLFFGSANALRDTVLRLLDADTATLKWFIIDFRHVVGLDVSAIQMLVRLQSDCGQRGVRLVLSGARAATLDMLHTALDNLETSRFATLDDALEHVEDALLADHPLAPNLNSAGILAQIQALQTDQQMHRYTQTITLQDGETLIEAGTRSTRIFLLLSGQLFVSVSRPGGAPKIVAKIRPNAMIGEMNFYLQGARTANVVAEGAAVVVGIDVQSLEGLQDDGSRLAAMFHKTLARQLSHRLQRTTTLLRNLES